MSLEKKTAGRLKRGLVALSMLAVCVSGVPVAASSTSVRLAQSGAAGKATFYLYSKFPQQMLSPTTGKTDTFMPLETRNIGGGRGEVTLSAEPDGSLFAASVKPDRVTPGGENGTAKSRVDVSCADDVPENSIGWIKVTGRRGNESHRIWLKVTALASQPSLQFSRGAPLTGQGHLDPELQPFTGDPVVWHVSAQNDGAEEDTYTLGYKADFPCEVTFHNLRGDKVNSVKVKSATRNLLYSAPAELTAQVVPKEKLPVNEPQEVTLILGPGRNTRKTAELTVRLFNPGEVFCINDMEGMRPHAHQVMPGETTSFMFHLTNLESKTKEMSLSAPGSSGGWECELIGADSIRLEPGGTADFTYTVTAPSNAKPGDHREFVVSTGPGNTGRSGVKVAVEVTKTPNIYFWAVDSMNPEYRYLNKEGTGPGKKGDWLMPNLQAFMKDGRNYKDAKVYLPSATDMNHTNALAGTYTGTQGIYMVGGTFKGFTKHDEVLSGDNTMALMRYGPQGKPIERMFEVAKQQTGGKALTGFWSNKNWLAELEGEHSVDIVGHSERWPLFFDPPYKYDAAGDPASDEDPSDPLSAPITCAFQTHDPGAVIVPTIFGQFDLYYGFRLLNMPISLLFGKTPGLHAEDRYIYESFRRSIVEEDPDVSYINVADLDNTGHFTGASWPQDEWIKSKRGTAYDENIYSPWTRRSECLDICREADALFGEFVKLLKERGTYDNSTIVFLADHGMENMKDPKKGYQVIDLRSILRQKGLLRFEDYNEAGGTEINMIWGNDPEKTSQIEKILESYTIDDPKLGKVHPLTVIDRAEMKNGKDFGSHGKVLPRELYSEYWINNPDEQDGELWPDLFVFPLYNYQVMAHGDAMSSGINNIGFSFGINIPDEVEIGFPAAHGGLQTESIPLIIKAPEGSAADKPGSKQDKEVRIGDIAPTIYQVMGWPAPECVDGKPLP
jgi:Type I phosphodiesterase / nucleotide pyrophosphatase